MRVLVTDAEYTLTLGAIRSLARQGVEVIGGAAVERAQGFLSRDCRERAVYPSPEAEPDTFVDTVLDLVSARAVDVVLPIGYAATTALSRRRDDVVARVPIPVAAWPAVEIAASKARTLELAERVGVPIPRMYAVAGDVDGFPVVVKGDLGSGQVRYANDPAELAAAARPGSLIQDYVPGEGRGLFALFDRGEERAVFMHRRLREFPATGGASTAAESVDDPALRELGLRLLRELDWHGVAMVEFKVDRRDGAHRLMEINPKFWGSLGLAIAAGVDFPWLAVRLARGERVTPPDYRVGVRFQWICGDLLRAAARPRDLPASLRDLLDPRVRHDVSLRDPRPHFAEARATGADLVRRVRSRSLRNPHGAPACVGGRK